MGGMVALAKYDEADRRPDEPPALRNARHWRELEVLAKLDEEA